ncbi:MAG: tetratricopeptide repeat protein [Aggregatilineales bacterium]
MASAKNPKHNSRVLWIYWRHHTRLRDAFWLLPGVDLWFSYRNLVTYWTYWLFPMLAALTFQRPATVPSSVTRPAHKWPTALAIGLAAAGLILAAIILAVPSPLTVTVQSPVLIDASGRVSEITVTVANASDHMLLPRFAVQHGQTYTNPVGWHIDAGPATLQPGEVGAYRIAAPEDADSFYVGSPGQVIVTDGGNQYALRGLTTIPPDRSFLWPDLIANPSYFFWNDAQNSPLYWIPQSNPPDNGSVAMVRHDGRDALELTLNVGATADNRATLETQTVFPTTPFTIGVYAGAALQDSTATVFGIEIDDGHHTLWLVFDKATYSGAIPVERMVTLSATPGQWTDVTIDLAHLYKQIGWPLPALANTAYRGIDADFRLITLRLFVAADGTHSAPRTVHAYFGDIQQTPTAPETFMADTFVDPAAYYVRIGDTQVAATNYSRAVEAYRRALDFAPNNPEILDKLSRATRYAEQDAGH